MQTEPRALSRKPSLLLTSFVKHAILVPWFRFFFLSCETLFHFSCHTILLVCGDRGGEKRVLVTWQMHSGLISCLVFATPMAPMLACLLAYSESQRGIAAHSSNSLSGRRGCFVSCPKKNDFLGFFRHGKKGRERVTHKETAVAKLTH